MHNKNPATASAQSAEIEGKAEDNDTSPSQEASTVLRNPFEDDGGDVDDDSDDGFGDEAGSGGPWTSGRSSWWLRREKERFGDGRDDSDSGKEEGPGEGEDEDEEFGDFAMPEVDKDGANEKANVIVKPLPVHPPPPQSSSSSSSSQNQQQKSSSAFTLWPFGSKDKEKQQQQQQQQQQDSSNSKGGGEDSTADNSSRATTEPQDMRGEDGEKLKSTHEAARRTSIEEPDDEDFVV